jgi:DNA anti-recombination protein RmuC
VAKPTNCTIKGIQEQEAQEHVNKKVSEIEIEVDTILDHHFGRVFDRSTSLNNTINAKNKSIRDPLEKSLGY